MSRGPGWVTVDCPSCPRRVKASPGSERIRPHLHPDGGRCAGSDTRVDLYGVGEVSR